MSHWTLDIYINNTVLAWNSCWNVTQQNEAKLNEQITILSAIKKRSSLLWMISAQSIYSTWRILQLKSLERYRLQHTITRYTCFSRLMKNIWDNITMKRAIYFFDKRRVQFTKYDNNKQPAFMTIWKTKLKMFEKPDKLNWRT